MAVTISGWRDLREAEKVVLAVVRGHHYGPQLFLVDPGRFLRDAGFAVPELFAAHLRAMPGVRVNPVTAYDEVLAGRHPLCKQSIAISSLGLPPGLGERS